MLSVAGVATGALLLTPRTGSLKVYVAGPGGSDVGPVDIYVGEQKVCSSSPCFVKDLAPGIHDVYAESVGYAPAATKGVEITAGGTATFDVALAEPGTGIEVVGAHADITLHIDGKEIGLLPQKIGTLSPGEHTLRFVGSDRYEAVTRTVTVIPNKLEDLGAIALPVAKAKATFDAAADVRVRLVPATGDPIAIESGQASMDLDPSKQWKLQACKPGQDLFETAVVFEAGKPEKTFRVELSGDGKDLPDWCLSKDRGRGAPTTPAAGSAPRADGPGKVSFNSIPAGAAVLVGGRPVGRTPVSGVSVPPGSHNVVFIHPEKGRKTAGVTVKAGQSTGVGVRF
jgi:serine/threonine-protein kinase